MSGKSLSAALAGCLLAWAGSSGAQSTPFDERPQPWVRQAAPALSARATTEDWCKVVLYSPAVIHHDGKFRMWYVGTSVASRTPDMKIGYAESADGLSWTSHSGNPILTGDDLPFAKGFQTPFVLFDKEEQIYKMWFVVVPGEDHNVQQLCYAWSPDGLKWKIHPKPIHGSARSPMILKTGPRSYRMWANSRAPGGSGSLFGTIYEFSSVDGLEWKQEANPAIRPSGTIKTCVYPFVVRDGDRYFMWYGGHRDGGMFELFCATSKDGSIWKTDHESPAFPAAPGKERFDSRYTSTPCMVTMPDRWLLYYSARDWNRDYIGADGVKRRDGSSPYSHVGVAVMSRGEH